MKIRVAFMRAASYFLIPFLLTGCWDRVEINDVALVSGTAVDKAGDQYRVSIQIPLPGQMGGAGSSGGGGGTTGTGPWQTAITEGKTIMHANQLQQQSVSRTLNFSHRRIMLFGEDLAREGLATPLDLLVRVPSNRLSSLTAITKGSAGEVLSADAPYEQLPAEMAREIVMQSVKKMPSLRYFTATLLKDGIDPILPYLSLEKAGEGDKTVIRLKGIAVFDEDKLTGTFQEEEATALLLAANQANTPVLRIAPPRGKGYVEIRLQKTSTDLKPSIEKGQPTVKLTIEANGWVADNESNFDATTKGNLQQLEVVVRKQVREQVEKTLDKLQMEYQSDPVGFGELFHREYPDQWKDWKKNWKKEYYRSLKVEVVTNIHLEHAGSITKQIGWKERELIR